MIDKHYLTAEYMFYMFDNDGDVIEYISDLHEALDILGAINYDDFPPELFELDVQVDLENNTERKLKLVIDNDDET